jgi:nitronate monooxygenase
VLLERLKFPIVLAPLAGGPATPQLAAAVSEAGGLGFLAAGYLTAAALDEQMRQAVTLTTRPLGVNIFVPGRTPAVADTVADYARTLAGEAVRAGAELGSPQFDTDDWDAKLDVVRAHPPAVVSFTFGCPSAAEIAAIRAAGSEVWVTVTNPADAQQAANAGADVLVTQGSESGGHRSSFRDDPAEDLTDGIGLLPLLQLVRSRTNLPMVAAGGISTGAAIAAVLAAGASAAQLGTAFLRCPEAGTSQVQREAVASDAPTAMTRAFTGRLARGIRNRFLDAHSKDAPAAYPEVHYLTAPLRRAARTAGNPDLVNLWAGQAHELARELPAAELVALLAADAATAARTAADKLRTG